MIDRAQIEKLVRQKLLSALRDKQKSKAHDFVNEKTILEANEQEIQITAGAIITPAAKDLALDMGISFSCPTCPEIQEYASRFTHQSIAVAADHGGFAMKEQIVKNLKSLGYHPVDLGTYSASSVDYPDFAYKVALAVGRGYCGKGIIIDGAGIGSAITANKVPGVRAANCHNLFEIRNSREHNDANILTLGSNVVGTGLAMDMIKLWLETAFAGGRHQRRVQKIINIEKREQKCHK